ncbi:helix-turn-helix domain-containing protein [Terrimonas alba]|uniref:helix-turn-helix domain-containing protein n=1 Tax=Terrimonas alba TaxID=3349636 RepID=UPI0035F42C87
MADITPDTSNTMFSLAAELVNKSSRNIFLTGKAGTGKTTFLKYIRNKSPKQMAIVAPTGVAAINAGGVTIHSFFQLPISPFIPASTGYGHNDAIADRHSLLSRLRLNAEKRKLLQELELLVIDEISMVRCDTLDAIDTILRHIRQRNFERFGGVQVLFIGDMYQLPPVVPVQEWQILSQYYKSPYFFDSKVIEEEPPVYIEFNKIYRQNDEQFIQLLNQIRNNEIDGEGLQILESRLIPDFRRSKNDGYIILTTHNRKADLINGEELEKITEKSMVYRAEITGEFPEKAYPAEEALVLKPGAQVMFIKNDAADKGKRYFNGKIGTIKKLEGDKITVQCRGEEHEIEVSRETWSNIRYSLNNVTRKLEEDVLGSFVQYPLRLAWSITIHKSQGLTFEKAIIDAEEAFAAGQVYVALSRCTNLPGLILQTRVRPSSLHSDSRIVAFSENQSNLKGLESELERAKLNYELTILLSTFDFAVALENCRILLDYIIEHKTSFSNDSMGWLTSLKEKVGGINEVAKKFQAQLGNLFQQEAVDHDKIDERLKAAGTFFKEKVNEAINYLQSSPVSTDSRQHAREYNDSLKEVFALLSLKQYLIRGFENGFSIDLYQQLKKAFTVPIFSINAYATASTDRSDLPHPSLYMQLKILRDSICSKANLPIYIVAGSNTLAEMSRYLPQTLAELRKISGFGEAKIEKYGQSFLDIIVRYSKTKGLESLIHEKTPKREKKDPGAVKKPKVDTKAESFKLFKEGRAVKEIAALRNLTDQTIEGHLAYYVQQGTIHIEELVSREKLVIIEPALQAMKGSPLNIIKEKLGSSIGFGEIKLAIAWKEFQQNQENGSGNDESL